MKILNFKCQNTRRGWILYKAIVIRAKTVADTLVQMNVVTFKLKQELAT